jgi:hypothetical protein
MTSWFGGFVTRPEREGKKQVSAFVTVEKWRKLRNVATNTDRTQTDLIDEAIDLLAEKYGTGPKQPTAKKTKRREPSP